MTLVLRLRYNQVICINHDFAHVQPPIVEFVARKAADVAPDVLLRLINHTLRHLFLGVEEKHVAVLLVGQVAYYLFGLPPLAFALQAVGVGKQHLLVLRVQAQGKAHATLRVVGAVLLFVVFLNLHQDGCVHI